MHIDNYMQMPIVCCSFKQHHVWVFEYGLSMQQCFK